MSVSRPPEPLRWERKVGVLGKVSARSCTSPFQTVASLSQAGRSPSCWSSAGSSKPSMKSSSHSERLMRESAFAQVEFDVAVVRLNFRLVLLNVVGDGDVGVEACAGTLADAHLCVVGSAVADRDAADVYRVVVGVGRRRAC